jgi:hypothetical protein
MSLDQRAPEHLAADARTAHIIAAIERLERTTKRLPLYFVLWSVIFGMIVGLLYAIVRAT